MTFSIQHSTFNIQNNGFQYNYIQHIDILINGIWDIDIQQNTIQHNDIQHDEIQHDEIQHNEIQHNNM